MILFNLNFVILSFLSFMVNFTTLSSEPVVAAYFDSKSYFRKPIGNRSPFSPSMIDPNLITDLYYAFAGFGYVSASIDPSHPHLTGDFTIQPLEKVDQTILYPQIFALKSRAKNGLQVFLSIGGWSFNDPQDKEGKNTYLLFSQMVSTAENRKQFIDSAIEYAHRFGFDGIDIDWEYPGDLTRGGKEEDFGNFLTFLKECKQAFLKTTPTLLLSYAAPPFIPYGVLKKYHNDPNSYFKWLADCTSFLDRINIMGYDYHGPFDIPKITGANAPLMRDTQPESSYYIAKTLENYLNNSVPANKMILGMPIFGHSYAGVSDLNFHSNGPGKPFNEAGIAGPATQTKGLLAYYEISDLIAEKKLFFGTDPITSTACAFSITSRDWVSFDTPHTIELKAELARKHSLKGVMFWSIDLDEYQWEPKFPNIRSATAK